MDSKLTFFFRQGVRNLYKLLKPGGQLVYITFERTPMDVAYEELDKTKWRKYNHSKAMSAFCKNKSPREEYQKLMSEIGFEENFITLEDERVRFPDLQTAHGEFTIFLELNIHSFRNIR